MLPWGARWRCRWQCEQRSHYGDPSTAPIRDGVASTPCPDSSPPEYPSTNDSTQCDTRHAPIHHEEPQVRLLLGGGERTDKCSLHFAWDFLCRPCFYLRSPHESPPQLLGPGGACGAGQGACGRRQSRNCCCCCCCCYSCCPSGPSGCCSSRGPNGEAWPHQAPTAGWSTVLRVLVVLQLVLW